jgi:hypothetical protein
MVSVALQLQASRALRMLLKELAQAGTSYAEIAQATDPAHGWSANAIKQLVYRDGAIRRTPRVAALALALKKVSERRMPLSGIESENIALIEFFAGGAPDPTEFDLLNTSKMLGQRFQSIRRASASFDYPRRQAFVRFDWSGERIITVLVDADKSREGYVFSMKITGRTGMRRIVVGDILSTFRNTYFSGLAYQLNEEISQDEFVSLNALNLQAVHRLVAPNELGLECFSIDNSLLHLKEIPVNFQGLDGRGGPISGVGAVIRESLFPKYNICTETFSAVECGHNNGALFRLLESFGARTSHYHAPAP